MDWALDWDRAIKRNSEALKGIIQVLFALLGLDGTGVESRIPRSLHSAVLRVLRPAESAVRRLIVVAARNVVVKLSPSRSMPKGHTIKKGSGESRTPAFRLCDTRKYLPEVQERRIRYSKYPPRILFLTPESRIDDLWPRPQPKAAPVSPDGLAPATRLHRRLQALKLALDDLPRQARRMARWRQRREAMPGPVFRSPLRPGPPPGHRKRKIHEVDEVLANCHWLAREALKPDTS